MISLVVRVKPRSHVAFINASIIASKLVKKLLENVEALGNVAHVYLHTPTTHVDAEAFYTRLGFVKQYEVKDYYVSLIESMNVDTSQGIVHRNVLRFIVSACILTDHLTDQPGVYGRERTGIQLHLELVDG